MTEISIKLPRLVYVDDYHEFRYLEDLLRDMASTRRIKVAELGLENGAPGTCRYIGIVYTRKDEDYRKLAKSADLMYRD